ncbi:MAG: hypothetical protein H7224_09320 [Polaromonas sp.]|nr:hypothetical protein [Polaromonas sp.]
MSYTVKLFAEDDVSPGQQEAAIARFKAALSEALGDSALVLPVYAAYTRIVATYGDDPSEDALSPGELAVFTQWQAAEAAALTAALGPNRYLGDAQFEILA